MGRQDGRKDDARMMTEMAYTSKRSQTVLHEGIYNGYKFYILSLGTHPVAYVECKLRGCKDYYDKRLEKVCVHGGFTYYGSAMWDVDDKKKYLGWDYAHYGDYVGYEQLLPSQYRSGGKKWTTEEIYEEVKLVIEQLELVRKINKTRTTARAMGWVAIAMWLVAITIASISLIINSTSKSPLVFVGLITMLVDVIGLVLTIKRLVKIYRKW